MKSSAVAPAAESAASELRCDQLTVRFDAGPAVLDRVDTTFAAGRITALIGPSGCGKTTLLRVLAGLQSLSAGRVQIHPAVSGGRGELAYVFQQPTLLPWRTAWENVALPLQLCRPIAAGRNARRTRAQQELAAMELPAEAWERFPGELSGGMSMRVSLARALVTTPRVLLLDEPFAALDDLSRSVLGQLLWRRWLQQSFTAVLVTHNISEAILLSHQIQVMGNGRVQAVIDNPLPPQRSDAMRTSAEFSQLYLQVSAAIWDRAAAVDQQPLPPAGLERSGQQTPDQEPRP